MEEGKFVNGVRFVADVVSANIETLPSYGIAPLVSDALEEEIQQERPRFAPVNDFISKGAFAVKRSCGHSQKSVREQRANIPPLKKK